MLILFYLRVNLFHSVYVFNWSFPPQESGIFDWKHVWVTTVPFLGFFCTNRFIWGLLEIPHGTHAHLPWGSSLESSYSSRHSFDQLTFALSYVYTLTRSAHQKHTLHTLALLWFITLSFTSLVCFVIVELHTLCLRTKVQTKSSKSVNLDILSLDIA